MKTYNTHIAANLLKARHSPASAQQTGFTLIELIIVIVAVGVLGSMIGLRIGSINDNTVPYYSELLVSHVRHVQSLSLTWGEPLRIDSTGTGYEVSCVTATAQWPCNATPVIDPHTNEPFTQTMDDGITLNAGTVAFDTWGRPINPADGSLLQSTQTFTVISSSNLTWQVKVEPVTGFVSMVRI
jgi:prepilin-type N-terminal cleavage/methylation domain-containing protein